MDNASWIAIAVFVVVVLVIFRFRNEIGIKFKGFGAEIEVKARDKDGPAREAVESKPGAGERSVQIGGSADKATIVTGDNNKVG